MSSPYHPNSMHSNMDNQETSHQDDGVSTSAEVAHHGSTIGANSSAPSPTALSATSSPSNTTAPGQTTQTPTMIPSPSSAFVAVSSRSPPMDALVSDEQGSTTEGAPLAISAMLAAEMQSQSCALVQEMNLRQTTRKDANTEEDTFQETVLTLEHDTCPTKLLATSLCILSILFVARSDGIGDFLSVDCSNKSLQLTEGVMKIAGVLCSYFLVMKTAKNIGAFQDVQMHLVRSIKDMNEKQDFVLEKLPLIVGNALLSFHRELGISKEDFKVLQETADETNETIKVLEGKVDECVTKAEFKALEEKVVTKAEFKVLEAKVDETNELVKELIAKLAAPVVEEKEHPHTIPDDTNST